MDICRSRGRAPREATARALIKGDPAGQEIEQDSCLVAPTGSSQLAGRFKDEGTTFASAK